MPPVAKAGGDAFRKEVEFVAKDDVEQKAHGIVMVPDKADLQQDFAREGTIRSFADEFGALYESGSADGGIMHAAWPSEWMSLERNEVLDEAEDIGGTTAPEGAWVQEWKFDDADTWSLVEDGVLEGYSIGAVNVRWDGPFLPGEDDAVDDVALPDQLPDDAAVWELIDGIVREVSAVDIPAVPDAEILETKADAEKRLGDYLGDRQGFIDEAMERGHTEAEAERLWDNLNRALEEEGARDPGKQSALAKAGKAFLSALSPGSSETATTDTQDTEPRSEKDGQTLSADNRKAIMASVDAGLDALHDAGVDVPKRFTDREDVDFDLSEHDAREWTFDDDDEEDDKHAADGETSDTDGSKTAAEDMSNESDTNDGGDADKSLAEQNAEQINELTDAVKSLTEAVDGSGSDADADKTAEVELPDGTVAEVSKEEAMSWFDDDDGGDGGKTASAEDEVTKADIEALHRRLDAITREAAGSQQLDRSGGGDDEAGKLDDIGKALS